MKFFFPFRIIGRILSGRADKHPWLVAIAKAKIHFISENSDNGNWNVLKATNENPSNSDC